MHFLSLHLNLAERHARLYRFMDSLTIPRLRNVMQPPLWIKHSEIASLETGRTSDKTRSFVLYVHHKDGKITEFNNIPR